MSSENQSDECSEQSFAAGHVIFREGQEADCAFYLESGTVEILKQGPGGNVVVARLEPGALFGEMALIDDAARSATAMAATDVSLVPVERAVFDAKLAKMDPFITKVFRKLIRNLRDTTKAAVDGTLLP
jgi:CRP-like cAMP-binding protein